MATLEGATDNYYTIQEAMDRLGLNGASGERNLRRWRDKGLIIDLQPGPGNEIRLDRESVEITASHKKRISKSSRIPQAVFDTLAEQEKQIQDLSQVVNQARDDHETSLRRINDLEAKLGALSAQSAGKTWQAILQELLITVLQVIKNRLKGVINA